MKLLVLGGTKFLGRHTVEAALGAGHEVTLFNRGRTNPHLFPEAEKLRGDLESDLGALGGGAWDAAIDLDATTLPRHVRRYASMLADRVEHFTFVSTISVYADPSVPLDEDSPVHEPPEPEPERFEESQYGGLKIGCERAVQDAFGDRAAVVRPGLITGPHDPTDRFTYWPRRLVQGGDVLAPGDPNAPVQLVDARDLGRWLVHLGEARTAGTFNATGPTEPLTLGALLERVAGAVGGGVRLVWVDDGPILAARVRPWSELPLWLPGSDYTGLMQASIDGALSAGLRLRLLEETAVETLHWDRTVPGERATLSPEREREILAAA